MNALAFTLFLPSLFPYPHTLSQPHSIKPWIYTMVKIASVALAALLVIIHKVKADVYSDAALASHNDVRQSYSAPGLTWNVALAADAKKHAELCRDTPSEGATKGQVDKMIPSRTCAIQLFMLHVHWPFFILALKKSSEKTDFGHQILHQTPSQPLKAGWKWAINSTMTSLNLLPKALVSLEAVFLPICRLNRVSLPFSPKTANRLLTFNFSLFLSLSLCFVSGKYSQIVWLSTTQVGCAQFECPKGTMTTSTGYKAETAAAFTVCRYSPPGNIAGQFAKNVNKPKTKWSLLQKPTFRQRGPTSFCPKLVFIIQRI